MKSPESEFSLNPLIYNTPPAPPPPEPPVDAGILFYLKQGFQIARWDETEIRRAARDPNAARFGILFFLIGLILLFAVELALSRGTEDEVGGIGIIIYFMLTVSVGCLLFLGRILVCHWIAKTFLGGGGTLAAVMRPMLVSSSLLWLTAIPKVGFLVAGFWWGLLVLMFVFEEIHEVRRMQTFLMSLVINLVFNALGFFLQ